MFAVTRFCFIDFFFHVFYFYLVKENRLLYPGFRYIEVVGGFIEVPLYSVVVTDLQAVGSQTEQR